MKEEIKPGYTRVTDVLFPLSGLGKIDPDILKNAARRGTEVHQIVECIIKRLGRFDSEETKPYIDSFEQWYCGKKFVETSKRFYDDKYMVTGECDGIYEDENGLTLVDFKTPRAESASWIVQGSAYSHMGKQVGYKINRIEFVQLMWTGKAAKSYFYKENFEMFIECLNVYKHFFKNKIQPIDTDYI